MSSTVLSTLSLFGDKILTKYHNLFVILIYSKECEEFQLHTDKTQKTRTSLHSRIKRNSTKNTFSLWLSSQYTR